MKKDRRKFFTSISLATAGIIGSGFIPKKAHAEKKVKWKMVTSWPKNFPGLGAGAETLANYINQLSVGTLKIKVYGANELVPPLGVFDFVSSGEQKWVTRELITGKVKLRQHNFFHLSHLE